MQGSTNEELRERAAIDGRVAFAAAALLAVGGLIAVLDRVGVPERVIAVTGPLAVLVALTMIGVGARSMRISRYYAAGRAAPAAYAGIATAAVAIGLAIPFTPPVGDRFSGVGLFAGFAGGLACAVLISGPFLRKTGAFSISDLIAGRFANNALRLGVSALVAISAFMAALAGYESAVSGLSTIAGLGRPASAALLGFALVMVAAPGGLSGVLWSAAAAGGVFVVAYGLPLALLAARGAAIPSPAFGDAEAWRAAMDRIAEWQGDRGQPASLTLSLGMALGMAAFAPLLAPLLGVRDRVASLRAGLGALFWGAIMAGLVAVTVAASTLGLLDSIVGRRPERLPDPIYAASGARLVTICDQATATPAQARAACQPRLPAASGLLRPEDVKTTGAFLVNALPPLASLGAAMAGLVWAATIAAGLVMAGSGFLAAAIALGNDAAYHVRYRAAMTSRRLATTRTILLGAVALGAGVLGAREFDPRALIGLALALSAAGLAPLMALTLWPRARGVDAIVAMIAGVAAAEALVLTGPQTVERVAAASVAGFVCAILAGILSSLVGASGKAAGDEFLERLLHGDGDVLGPDKGA